MATVVYWENFETKTLLLTRKRFKELCRSLVYRSLHLHERAVNIVLTRVELERLLLIESKEDLINKCDYYLEHDNERRQIAANGFGKVNEFHTYKVRLKEIFDVVF